MATLTATEPLSRPQTLKLLMGLLLAQFVGIGGLLPYYAFVVADETVAFKSFSVGLILLALFTMYSVWTQKWWAPWAVLTLVSIKLTVDIFNWALSLDPLLLPLSQVINGGIILLAFRLHYPSVRLLTRPHRLFYGAVLLLAAFVGLWGFFIPSRVDFALPWMVPPLHARFLGAMYFSGVTGMAFSLLAREWAEVRVTTPMIAIWTGMLGIVSLFYLGEFDFTRQQTWVWFVAYIAFPILSAWITWKQRDRASHLSGPPLSALLRGYLAVQGVLVTAFALVLLLWPAGMAALWPWKISQMLVQMYGAPLLAYGTGSLLALREHTWREVRIAIYAMLLFAAGVLIASLIHRGLFDFSGVTAWLWFGTFWLVTLFLGLFALFPAVRTAPAVRRLAQ